jgi:hypothetical protein
MDNQDNDFFQLSDYIEGLIKNEKAKTNSAEASSSSDFKWQWHELKWWKIWEQRPKCLPINKLRLSLLWIGCLIISLVVANFSTEYSPVNSIASWVFIFVISLPLFAPVFLFLRGLKSIWQLSNLNVVWNNFWETNKNPQPTLKADYGQLVEILGEIKKTDNSFDEIYSFFDTLNQVKNNNDIVKLLPNEISIYNRLQIIGKPKNPPKWLVGLNFLYLLFIGCVIWIWYVLLNWLLNIQRGEFRKVNGLFKKVNGLFSCVLIVISLWIIFPIQAEISWIDVKKGIESEVGISTPDKANEYFKRYQYKPDVCDILIDGDESKYNECLKFIPTPTSDNQEFDSNRQSFFENSLKRINLIAADLSHPTVKISWQPIKLKYELIKDNIVKVFKDKYSEKPYLSLLKKLDSNKVFQDSINKKALEVYTKKLNDGKYKRYDVAKDDLISGYLQNDILKIDSDSYQDQVKLAKAIYRYQFNDKNLFVNGLVSEDRSPETFQLIKLEIRRKLNEAIRENSTYKEEFPSFKSKALKRFDDSSLGKISIKDGQEDDVQVLDSTKAALEFIVKYWSEQYTCSSVNALLVQASLFDELNSVTLKYDLKKNDDLTNKEYSNRKSNLFQDAVDNNNNNRENLISAIFDYQIGYFDDKKQQYYGWDGIITPGGGSFNNIKTNVGKRLENVSSKLGCQKRGR